MSGLTSSVGKRRRDTPGFPCGAVAFVGFLRHVRVTLYNIMEFYVQLSVMLNKRSTLAIDAVLADTCST